MDRRTFLELGGAGAAGTVLSCAGKPNVVERHQRPNVVVIVADDLGWNDVGYHGSLIRTPRIDRMARDGVELDRFYVYPVGAPTRTSLLTGRIASRLGVAGQLGATGPAPLDRSQPTIASLLRRTGYDTALTGKWNLGNELSNAPDRYGFNHSHGFLGPWIDHYTHRTTGGRRAWYRNGAFVDEAGHATDLIAAEAVRFIAGDGIRDPAKPFYLHVAFSAPHLPLQEDPARLRRYRNMFVNESRRYYAAMVTHLDDAVGRILDELGRRGLAENTLVIFLSDNGAEPPGTKSYLDPAATLNTTADTALYGSNDPLGGGKHTMYEGGIRVPALMYWPGRLGPLKVMDTVMVQDILPTILGRAGAGIRPDTALDGIDVWPAVTGAGTLRPRILYLRLEDAMSVTVGGWKLIHVGSTPDRGRDELYYIGYDQAETYDQSGIDTAIRDALRVELGRQFAFDEDARRERGG